MIYWVWLSAALGAGNKKFSSLIEKYKTAKAIFDLGEKELSLNSFLSKKEIEKLKNKNLFFAKKTLETCKEDNIKIIPFNDKQYPQILRELENPPVCLYVLGEFFDFDNNPFICIVGKRDCSDYGKKVAWSLAARLSLGGITVLSGGARGIDTAAHKGALDVGAKTVAVLACGINYDYLKANRELRETISKNGCLISEYPPSSPVFKENFALRNRLRAALTYGTVIVESGEGSGATITANHAVEQGKEVFVITGKPDDPNYYGNNRLLRDGAKPVIEANDIFLEYISYFGDKILPNKANETNLSKVFAEKYNRQKTDTKAKLVNKENDKPKMQEKLQKIGNIENLPLSKNAKVVYNCIDNNLFILDDLLSTGLSFDELLTAVTELELSGLVKAVPGGRYSVLR